MIIIPATPSGVKTATVKGVAVGTTSVTLPTYDIGDTILMFASYAGNTLLPYEPSAGGTVPTWNVIGSPTTSNACKMCYTVTTQSGLTSGSWSSSFVMAVVVSGQIGGYAYATQVSTKTATAPSITLSNSSGASQILHFAANEGYGWYNYSVPSGYTEKTSGSSPQPYRLLTKNDTTTDGSVTIGKTFSNALTTCSSLEITPPA